MDYNLDFFKYGDSAILISWPRKIDENILNNLLEYKSILENKLIKQIIEVIHAYNSILVIYNSTIDNFNSTVKELKELYNLPKNNKSKPSVTWEIPVCYDKEFGFDLESLCRDKNISHQDLVEFHSTSIYTVFFLGFLPGFPYLGGLDTRLHTDRKTQPNLTIPKGSVAIGGQQTGIYTQNSPGGWHVIGRTPVDFFNPILVPPTPLKPGHRIQFRSISKEEFKKIQILVKNSNYSLKQIMSC